MKLWSFTLHSIFLAAVLGSIVTCSGNQSSTTTTSRTAPPTTTAPVFPLHVSGPYIVDSKGSRVVLHAFNWYGAESTDFVVAGLELQPLARIVATIKGLGFNAARLPWSNQTYESNPIVASYALAANPGMEGQNALTIFDQVIAALTAAGIMVVLDNHNSNAEWCCDNDGNTLWYNSAAISE